MPLPGISSSNVIYGNTETSPNLVGQTLPTNITPAGAGVGISGSNQNLGQSISPSVVTSKAATNDLNNIQGQHTDIVNGINAQAQNVAANKAAADAQAQVQAEKSSTDKANADKFALDKKNADLKAAVIMGNTTPTPNKVGTIPGTPENTVVNDIPYGNNQRQVTYGDGTREIYNQKTNPDGTVSYIPLSKNELDIQNNQEALAQANTEFKAKGDAVSKLISDISNGVIPLNAGEQAQVQGLQASFQQLINQQILANQAASGEANIRGYQKGAAEYDPNFQVKTIGAIVSAGINKVADLNIKMASEVAKLTQGFKDNDIKSIKESWDVYKQASQDRQKYLKDTIDDAQKAIKDANDASEKDRNYNLDVLKFQQTEDKDAWDRAFKQEQLAAEKEKNKLQYGANNISQGLTATGGVKMGVDGRPDQVSQKAFLDDITSKYGPATAAGIKGLTDYTINPSSFSNRSTGINRSLMTELASLYDPSYDQTQFAARQKFVTQWNAANNPRVPINTAISHLGELNKIDKELEDVFSNKGGMFSKSYNTVNEWLLDHKQDPRAIKFNETAEKVADELAKAYKGGTASATDTGQEKERILLSIKNSPAQKDAAVETAVNLLGDYVQTYNQNYESVMGKAPDGNKDVIFPNAASALRIMANSGLNVDLNRFGVKSETASKVTNALSSGYSPTEIISEYANNPEMASKIQAAKDAGYTDDEIVTGLQSQ